MAPGPFREGKSRSGWVCLVGWVQGVGMSRGEYPLLTPPGTETWDTTARGRYASYWNAVVLF